MTDRVAALAEALAHPDAFGWLRDNDRINEFNLDYFGRKAAAILAALPPDWCGHDPGLFPFASRFAAYEAEIKRLRELLAAEHRAQFAMRHNPGACETCDILPDDALLEVPG